MKVLIRRRPVRTPVFAPWLCACKIGLLVLVYALAPSIANATEDGNLVEYSYGGFAEGDLISGPMLFPPIVKIYQDGRIVFIDDRGIWHGQVHESPLKKLTSYLASNSLLHETRLIPVKKGVSPGFHGGMAYIRYLDGEKEVIIGALRIPTSGPWDRLLKEIRACIPSSYSSFQPASVSVSVWRGSTWDTPVQWPFISTIPLAPEADEVARYLLVEDPKAIFFILQHARGGFSWLQCAVADARETYSIHIESVPGWYEPSGIEAVLGGLAYEAKQNPH